MAVLSPEARTEWRDARRLFVSGLAWLLYAAGWVVAKSLRLIATTIGAVFYAAGWTAAKVWPGVVWCASAVQLGWNDGRKPIRR
jgi:hypothetical protein